MDVYIHAAKAPKGLTLDFGDKVDAPFDEDDHHVRHAGGSRAAS